MRYNDFLVVLACLGLLLLPTLQSDGLAACASPAKIVGYSYSATSVQNAYNYASTTLGLSDFTLQLSGEILTEDLLLDGGNVTFDGGYECTFAGKSGATTGLLGSLTIRGGSANFTGDVKVVSTTQCAFDFDGDGYSSVGSCSGTADDCNDSDPNIHPGAAEVCDAIDNDCNGQIDDGAIPTDADADGYYAIGSCGNSPYTDDCDDADGSINPGALDTPFDGIDQDCSGADLTYAEDGLCNVCHSFDVRNWDVLHAAVTAPAVFPPASNCATCHNPEVNNVLPGHYGNVVLSPGNNMNVGETIVCVSCHDLDEATHSFGGPIGTGSNVVWGKVIPVRGSVSCDTCHENRASVHEDTALSHDNRGIDAICGTCHTSDPSVLGSSGSGTLVSSADVDALHGNDCGRCHNYSGSLLNAAVVREVIAQGVSGTQVSCLDCHTDKGVGHSEREHKVAEGPGDLSNDFPGQPCSDCHTVSTWSDIEGIVHNIASNGAGSCATCHNSSRPDVRNAITLGANPTNCLACHADKGLDAIPFHGNAAHGTLGYVTGGTTYCVNCHDPGAPENGAVVTIHKGICSHCHTRLPELQPGLPLGGGDCTACHTNSWENTHISNPPSHNSLVQLGSTGCASCHNDPPPLTDSGDPKVHNGCGSCHDNFGGLVSHAVGKDFLAGGDCTTCHTGTWEATHVTAPNHGMIVTVAGTGCDSCHDDTLVSAAANTHNACITCHDANTGALVSLAAGKSAPGNCTSCHVNSWEATHAGSPPDHSSLVQVAATGCATCHDNTLTSAAENTHNGCSSCHAVDGSLRGFAVGKDFTTGGNCTICHTGTWAATHVVAPDHTALVTVSGVTCANCHTDTLVGVRSHFACITCHDTNSGALINLATGKTFAAGGNCTTCHLSAWETTHVTDPPDHSALVQVAATDCATCHNNTLTSAEPNTHNSCSTCHDSQGGLIGLATSKTFAAGGDCATCHLNSWESTHTTSTPDHSSLVRVATTGCASCHDNTLISGANNTHNGCSNCHNSDGSLRSFAIGKDFTSGGDCTTCHTSSWSSIHTSAPDHGALVTTSGTGCASCHDDPPPLVDNGDPKAHNACTTCHSSSSGALLSYASGKTFSTGGNCTTCHTSSWDSIHTVAPSHTAIVTTSGTECASCHDNTLISASRKTHDSCGTCHSPASGALINLASGKTFSSGGNCTTCHSSNWGAIHINAPDHSALVNASGIRCSNCHDSTLVSSAVNTHDGCSNCHSSSSGALISLASGKTFDSGGNCLTCHVTSRHHNNSNADSGMCESCHTWPADVNNLPKQLACRQCHGDNQHGKNTAGPIMDYRICFDCHSADGDGRMQPDYPLANPVLPHHASPGQSVGLGSGSDVLAPGRGSFNLFYSQWGGIEKNRRKFGRQRAWRSDEALYQDPMISYNTTQVSEQGSTYTVPYFDEIAGPGLLDSTCTTCHSDRSSLVACDNPQWTAHISQGWVGQTVYNLAETTYLGATCGAGDVGAGTNLALYKAASASDDDGSSYRASNAVDGSSSSYWYVSVSSWSRGGMGWSGDSDEWLKVDLGQNRDISKITVKWHSSEYAENYQIQVSTNNLNWTTVRYESSGNGGTDTAIFSSRSARYVRIYCTREHNNGYGIYELEVYRQ